MVSTKKKTMKRKRSALADKEGSGGTGTIHKGIKGGTCTEGGARLYGSLLNQDAVARTLQERNQHEEVKNDKSPAAVGAEQAAEASKSSKKIPRPPLHFNRPRSETAAGSSDLRLLSETFNSAAPFRHLVVDDFLNPEFCENLRQELIQKLDVKPKETDLFKFHQTQDLASLLEVGPAEVRPASEADTKSKNKKKRVKVANRSATEGGPAAEVEDVGEVDARHDGGGAAPDTETEGANINNSNTAEIAAAAHTPQPQRQQLPCLRQLSSMLYSKEFRASLQKKLGLDAELVDRVDMSAQAYTQGCHLMCHDDVISTRKVTFVLYLDEPVMEVEKGHGEGRDKKSCIKKQAWLPEWGGGMEFYLEEDPTPVGELLPDFNTLLLFGVEPGKSYHAVREVTSAEKTRLSLQGWYHVAQIEDTFSYEQREEKATLSQLVVKGSSTLMAEAKKKAAEAGRTAEAAKKNAEVEGGDHLLEEPCSAEEEEEEDESASSGSEEDSVQQEEDMPDFSSNKVLQKWIKPEYLTSKGLFQLRQHFKENSEVLLTSFLREKTGEELQKLVKRVDAADQVHEVNKAVPYSAGVHAGWQMQGPSFLRRFLTFDAGAGAVAATGSRTKSMKSSKPSGPATESHASKLGSRLEKLRVQLFQAKEFREFLRAIVGLPFLLVGDQQNQATTLPDAAGAAEERKKILAQQTPVIRRFRPGLDYTIATLQSCVSSSNMLDICYMVVDDSDSFPWDSEEVGGFESYVEADTDETEEKAEVYRENEDDGPLLNIPAVNNALSLVLRDKKTLSFLKFLAKAAPSSRVDVKMSLAVV